MFASLLRRLYLFQVITGALLGTFVAVPLAQNGAGFGALIWIAVGAVLLPLSLQVMVIGLSMLMSRPMDAGLAWWRACWGELLAALQIYGLQLPWTVKRPEVLAPMPGAQGQTALPVLLVHGFICNHRVWDKLALTLRQARHPVLAVNLEPLFTSIDDYAPLIEEAAARLCSQTGASQVALLGHSMGGLAIRAWARVYGTQRIGMIMTLGTPHHGTRAPQWFNTPNGAQMAWHSRWLAELAQHETPALRQLMHLALSHHDNIVFPQRLQSLEGTTLTKFAGLGHLQLCIDASVIEWVLQKLALCNTPVAPNLSGDGAHGN